MHIQVIQDSNGNSTGVFIPIEEWNQLTNAYPDLERFDSEIPGWHKEILDERLKEINDNPQSLRPIEDLMDMLDNGL